MDLQTLASPETYAQWGIIGAFVFSNLTTLGILIWLLLSVYKIQEESRAKDRMIIENNTTALKDLQKEIAILASKNNG